MLSNFEDYEAKAFYHTEPIQLLFEKWAFVYSGDQEQYEYANKLIDNLKNAS